MPGRGGENVIQTGSGQESNDQLSNLQTNVAVLIERTNRIIETNVKLEAGQDKLVTKIEALDSKFATKEELKSTRDDVADVKRTLRWIWQAFGALIIGGIMTTLFRNGLVHIP